MDPCMLRTALCAKLLNLIKQITPPPPYTHTLSDLLCSSGLVASPQVVDVDDESSFVLADHVPDFTLVNALVLLQDGEKRKTDRCLMLVHFESNSSR